MGEHSRAPCCDRHAGCALPAALPPLSCRVAKQRMTGPLAVRPAPYQHTRGKRRFHFSPALSSKEASRRSDLCPQLALPFSSCSLAQCRRRSLVGDAGQRGPGGTALHVRSAVGPIRVGVLANAAPQTASDVRRAALGRAVGGCAARDRQADQERAREQAGREGSSALEHGAPRIPSGVKAGDPPCQEHDTSTFTPPSG
jgi:hypothetical protein